jgi:hypothetical protein
MKLHDNPEEKAMFIALGGVRVITKILLNFGDTRDVRAKALVLNLLANLIDGDEMIATAFCAMEGLYLLAKLVWWAHDGNDEDVQMHLFCVLDNLISSINICDFVESHGDHKIQIEDICKGVRRYPFNRGICYHGCSLIKRILGKSELQMSKLISRNGLHLFAGIIKQYATDPEMRSMAQSVMKTMLDPLNRLVEDYSK